MARDGDAVGWGRMGLANMGDGRWEDKRRELEFAALLRVGARTVAGWDRDLCGEMY